MSATRPSSTAGLSSQAALLLALAGAGLAVCVVFVLPRTGASRAAGPRASPPPAEPQDESRPETVELAQPIGLESEAVAQVEVEAETAALAAVALAGEPVVEGKPKMEGPPLRRQKSSSGSRDTLAHEQLQSDNKERRRARRERAASGEAELQPDGRTGEVERPRSVQNPARKRVNNSGGAGRGQGQGKGRKPRKG